MNKNDQTTDKMVWEKPTMSVVAASEDIRSGGFIEEEDFTATPS